jgi:potassium channel subfamily T protein 1
MSKAHGSHSASNYSPSRPATVFKDAVAALPLVYYMVGKFESVECLLRAGVTHADYVVVVNKEGAAFSGTQEEFAADSNTIVAVQTASK